MKATAAVMAALGVLLGVLCQIRGGSALVVGGLRAGSRGAGKLVPLLVVVFLLAGFIEVLLPRD